MPTFYYSLAILFALLLSPSNSENEDNSFSRLRMHPSKMFFSVSNVCLRLNEVHLFQRNLTEFEEIELMMQLNPFEIFDGRFNHHEFIVHNHPEDDMINWKNEQSATRFGGSTILVVPHLVHNNFHLHSDLFFPLLYDSLLSEMFYFKNVTSRLQNHYVHRLLRGRHLRNTKVEEQFVPKPHFQNVLQSNRSATTVLIFSGSMRLRPPVHLFNILHKIFSKVVIFEDVLSNHDHKIFRSSLCLDNLVWSRFRLPNAYHGHLGRFGENDELRGVGPLLRDWIYDSVLGREVNEKSMVDYKSFHQQDEEKKINKQEEESKATDGNDGKENTHSSNHVHANVVSVKKEFDYRPMYQSCLGDNSKKMRDFWIKHGDKSSSNTIVEKVPIRITLISRSCKVDSTSCPLRNPNCKRCVNNEEEIVSLLKTIFETVYVLDFSVSVGIEHILRVLRATDILFGIHGAGLGNSFYLRPDSFLVELKTDHGHQSLVFSNYASQHEFAYFASNVLSFASPTGIYLPPNYLVGLAHNLTEAFAQQCDTFNIHPQLWYKKRNQHSSLMVTA